MLIADDHPGIRECLLRLLQEVPDLEMLGASKNGKQAVEMANQLKPNVMIMDISMPEMNGIKATRIIKNKLPEIVIIIFSIDGYSACYKAALKAGASGCLSKGSSLKDIVELIHRTVDTQYSVENRQAS